MTNARKLNKTKFQNTQQYLDISEIKADTVILKDGTLRGVIMVSSINFALKSEDEQNGIISQYVSFLNNIDFPIQIVVQSRELSIDDYLNTLKKKEKEQTNELLKVQMREYMNYIIELISVGKIMSKKFFVIVPYDPLSNNHKNFFQSLTEAFKPATTLKIKEERFRRLRAELTRRVETVLGGLSSIGLNSVQLDTQGLIELYYNTYNPTVSKREKLVDIKELKVEN